MYESMSGNVTHASLGLGYPYLFEVPQNNFKKNTRTCGFSCILKKVLSQKLVKKKKISLLYSRSVWCVLCICHSREEYSGVQLYLLRYD